ncbi:MAG: hypothetical protein PVJ57_00915 [Phycisphaerae bacterium]|jgi:hypothetical protein
MMRPRMIQLTALVACVALVYGAAQFVPAVNKGRQALNMYGSADVLENAPPEYAFAIQAFGAFRSIIVNIAFIRAETYKEEGRYYDAMQLASWICRLQPHFPSVWEFQAWNMAWNISVTTYTAEERWNWVYNGVRLLRDAGIEANPRSVNLYKQLAWIFNNKMGENMDDFHWEYKRNWAWRMHLVLGPRPSSLGAYTPEEKFEPVTFDVATDPLLEMARTTAEQQEARRQQRREELGVPYRTTRSLEERLQEIPLDVPSDEGPLTPAQIRQRVIRDYLQRIANAPAKLAGLYEAYPETRDMVARLREIGVEITDDTLTEDTYWYDGKLAQTFFSRYRGLLDTPSLRETISAEADEAAAVEAAARERLDEILGARAGNPAGRALVRFLQRKVLLEVYKLDPAAMVKLVEHFGPLDWRVVDTQSLYWVTQGLIRGGETISNFQNDKTNTARILFFSLRNLFLRNRITFEPNPEDVNKSYINFSPDIDFVEPMHRAFVTYAPMIDPDPGNANNAGETFRSGHVNFLREAIRMLWFSNRVDEAQKYYTYLNQHYGIRPDGSVETRYQMPLRDFVVSTFYGNIETPRETGRLIADLLYRAYEALADEDAATYNQLVSKALEFHTQYTIEHKTQTTPRMALRPFQDYQIDMFREWFNVPVLSSTITIHKAHLWRVAPPTLKQWVYDDLIGVLSAECAAWNFDPAKAFPEPPGMAEFREAHPRREVDRQETDVETVPEP